MKRCVVWFGLLACLSLHVSRAHADSCFKLDAHGQATTSSARRVTLATRISTNKRCEYALSAEGTWHALDAQESDFAGLVETLTSVARTPLREPPTTLYARARQAGTATRALESVFLAGCTETLLNEASGFSVRVPIDTQRPTVSRSGGDRACGADLLTLGVLAIQSTGSAALLQRGPFAHVLPPGAAELVLEPGSYAIYGSRSDNGVGYLLGRITTESASTPLRQALDSFDAGTPSPWLRAKWSDGRLLLAPTAAARDAADAWSELKTAAASGAAYWQRAGSHDRASTPLAKLTFAEAHDAITLPDDQLRTRMSRRYGDAGHAMAPDVNDWHALTEELAVCVMPSYALAGQPSASMQSGARCVHLAKLLMPLTVQGGLPLDAGRVCIDDRSRIMTSQGVADGAALPQTCVDLTTQASPHEASEAFPLATRGAQLRFEGSGADHLFVCVDNECAPMPAADAALTLDRRGLVEIRYAETLHQASSSQALTRARIGVIDPATQWHPVGVHTADAQHPSGPWHTLLHDNARTFTYARRRQRIDFRLSVTPTLAAAWNQRAQATTQLTQDLPIFGGIQGMLGGAKAPALVTLITRESACPQDPARVLAEALPLDPEQLQPDQDFYVQLAHRVDDETPLRCLARARFRVVDSRSLRAADQLRVGLLGDAQLLVFVTRPAAIGMSLPLVYGVWRWGYGFGLDASIAISSAITFSPSEISRSGLMASTALVWGPEHVAPRLLSFGIGLHAATGTHQDAPFGSVYLGLNLSSLMDMAGGR